MVKFKASHLAIWNYGCYTNNNYRDFTMIYCIYHV